MKKLFVSAVLYLNRISSFKQLPLILPFILSLPLVFLTMANKNGSQGGLTGSPGDAGNNCTSCHNSTVTDVSGWITTDIPSNGYTPGQIYQITLTASGTSALRYGFELTAEDAGDNKIATFELLNTTETRFTNAKKAVTHTISGITPVGNSKSWSFNWTAPDLNAGAIKFYAAVNAANGNGVTSGDEIFTTSLSVSPSVTDLIDEESVISEVYPNPSSGIVYLNVATATYRRLIVYNSKGQIVEQLVLKKGRNSADFTHLSKGIYFLKYTGEKNSKMRQLIIE